MALPTATTWVEISRRALVHNVRRIRSLLPPQVDLLAVVKSNAYGHGLVPVVEILRRQHVKWYGTFDLAESLQLRRLHPQAHILCLSYAEPAALPAAIRQRIRLPVYSLGQLTTINRAARMLNRTAFVHIKIDTGTTRLGLQPSAVLLLIRQARRMSHVRLEGIFTHLADAEQASQHFTNQQLSTFEAVVDRCRSHGVVFPLRHAACSAAILQNRRSCYDLARAGIALYGQVSLEQRSVRNVRQLRLQPVLSWHTRIIQTQTIPPGTTVGYGQTYRARRTRRIAVIPVGYWDGYDRKLSNRSYVLVSGYRCPVRGRVCMNMTMVDVTAVPRARVGERVTLIGRQGTASVSADELASLVGTINYEVLTRINPTLPRITTP